MTEQTDSYCPWCREWVAIRRGVIQAHSARYMAGAACPASDLTMDRAQDLTDEAIMRHAGSNS